MIKKPGCRAAFVELGNEVLYGFNPSADANFALDLIPAGDYHVSVTFLETDPDRRWTSRNALVGRHRQDYVSAKVLATVIYPGPYNGRTVTSTISTLNPLKDNSSAHKFVVAIGLLGDPSRRAQPSSAGLVRLLTPVEVEPWICIASIDWAVDYWDSVQRRVTYRRKDMRNFPKDAAGNYIPKVTLPNGEEVYARNVVRAWKPIEKS